MMAEIGTPLVESNSSLIQGSSSRGSETAVGMGALFLRGLAVPKSPFQLSVLRRDYPGPPTKRYCHQILHHVGKDGALLGGNQSVGIGLHVSAGNAEKPFSGLMAHRRPSVLAHQAISSPTVQTL